MYPCWVIVPKVSTVSYYVHLLIYCPPPTQMHHTKKALTNLAIARALDMNAIADWPRNAIDMTPYMVHAHFRPFLRLPNTIPYSHLTNSSQTSLYLPSLTRPCRTSSMAVTGHPVAALENVLIPRPTYFPRVPPLTYHWPQRQVRQTLRFPLLPRTPTRSILGIVDRSTGPHKSEDNFSASCGV